jgi:hypothetical protein
VKEVELDQDIQHHSGQTTGFEHQLQLGYLKPSQANKSSHCGLFEIFTLSQKLSKNVKVPEHPMVK